MKNIIKKILKEEVEDDGFDWIRDIKFDPGQFFNDKEICFDNGNEYECDIIISDDKYVIYLTDDELYVDFLELEEHMSPYLDSMIYGNSWESDLGNMDDEEFNYITMTGHQENGFRGVIRDLGLGSFDPDNGDFFHLMSSGLYDNGYLDIYKRFREMVTEVLYEVEYFVDVNKWEDLRRYFKQLKKETGIDFRPEGNIIKVVIPINVVNDNIKNSTNLTDLVRDCLYRFNQDWYETFHDSYDASGAFDEYSPYIDKFIEYVNNLIDNDYMDNSITLKHVIRTLGIVRKGWRKLNYEMVDGINRFSFTDFNNQEGDVKVSYYSNDQLIEQISLDYDKIIEYVINKRD